MKKVIYIAVIISLFILAILGTKYFKGDKTTSSLNNVIIPKEKKLDKYSYAALQKTTFSGSEIVIDKMIKDEENFASYLFYFYVKGKKVSGLINIPKKTGNYPVIIMIRGYVDQSIYEPGLGTSHGGEVLAQNGFITLAPDFLGYGSSDNPPNDVMEDRFLTYVTVLELIASTNNLNVSLENKAIKTRFNNKSIGIWGHSNGGQIALSVLEISEGDYPTVLWAPVSKPFPYSILYYTDDIDDHGKALRKVVSDFEKDYDAEKYSLTNYFDWIKAPIQIHQGGADEAVPQKWSDTLTEALKEKDKNVEYFTYSGEDHNFTQGSWSLVMQRTIKFYKNNLD